MVAAIYVQYYLFLLLRMKIKIDKLLNFTDWISTDEGYRICKYGIEGIHWALENGELDLQCNHGSDKMRLDGEKMEGADAENLFHPAAYGHIPEQLTEDALGTPLSRLWQIPCTGICLSACLQRNIVCIMRIW